MTNNGSPANVSGMIEVAAGKERYFRWYEAICARGQRRAFQGYVERHHVVPRALGGTDDEANLTSLTAREHFVVHWLLVRFTSGAARRKMQHALSFMTAAPFGSERAVVSWQYEVVRKACSGPLTDTHRARISAAHKGKKPGPLPREQVAKIAAANTGKTRTLATRLKMSAAQKGLKSSAETCAKISAAKKGVRLSAEHRAKIGAGGRGKTRSEETRARMKAAQSGRKCKPFSDEHRANIGAAHKGRMRSEETREKMKQAWVRRKAARANNELASHAVA